MQAPSLARLSRTGFGTVRSDCGTPDRAGSDGEGMVLDRDAWLGSPGAGVIKANCGNRPASARLSRSMRSCAAASCCPRSASRRQRGAISPRRFPQSPACAASRSVHPAAARANCRRSGSVETPPVREPLARHPQISFATLQPGKIAQNRLALLPVGLPLDPCPDRVPVLACRQLHRDQDIHLRQHILVHHGRTLRDQPGNEPATRPRRTISSMRPSKPV
jgi:hypothetical protein